MIETGIDIVEIKRIEKLIDDPKFVSRIFSDEEVLYCRKHKHYVQHFAVRFAAKEAVIKAIGKKDIPLKEISIAHFPSGKPKVVLGDKWKDFESKLSISLSHCDAYAIAQVIYLNN